MAKRRFELPGIHELSKDQELARARPKEGQHLIIGGPGTGKSVLALLRSRQHLRDRDDYLFLVYNHLLHKASKQLFSDTLQSQTWDKWFRKFFKELFRQSIPMRPPSENSSYRPIDWNGVLDCIRKRPSEAHGTRPFLVIDEGQDMPPQFYQSLVWLGFENFFVLADQNQQITESNSNIQQIRTELDIEARSMIELKTNYRNTWPVARLAREFYTGDPATPPPELPRETSEIAPLLLTSEGNDRIGQNAKDILRMVDRDPRQLVGLLAPNNSIRQQYVAKLQSVEVQLDNPRANVKTYCSGDRSAEISYDEGGILVINAQACKGLEFDVAVLLDVDGHFFRQTEPEITRRLFYVMIARAKARVVLLANRGNPNLRRIEQILPTNSSILRRRDL